MLSKKLQSHVESLAKFILSKTTSPADFNSAYTMSIIWLEYEKIHNLQTASPKGKLELMGIATNYAEYQLNN